MQETRHTGTKEREALRLLRIVGEQIVEAVRGFVDCLSSTLGGIMQGLRDIATLLGRLLRVHASASASQPASRMYSAAMLHKPLPLQSVSPAILSMRGTGSILACFKKATMPGRLMDSAGTHTLSPLQHTSISLLVDVIGHRGHASREVCVTRQYADPKAVYHPDCTDYQAQVYAAMVKRLNTGKITMLPK